MIRYQGLKNNNIILKFLAAQDKQTNKKWINVVCKNLYFLLTSEQKKSLEK